MVLGALVVVIVGILVVNYFKDKKATTLEEALSTSTPQATAQIGKTHTVAKGETLWSIAEDAYGSGYNWVDIYNANKLKSQNVEVGQKLEIPSVTAKKPTADKGGKIAQATQTPKPSEKPVSTASAAPKATDTVKPTAAPSTAQTTNATSYTVVKGDNLWKIAVKNYGDGYKWVTIAKANKLANPNLIHPGNVLSLPR